MRGAHFTRCRTNPSKTTRLKTCPPLSSLHSEQDSSDADASHPEQTGGLTLHPLGPRFASHETPRVEQPASDWGYLATAHARPLEPWDHLELQTMREGREGKTRRRGGDRGCGRASGAESLYARWTHQHINTVTNTLVHRSGKHWQHWAQTHFTHGNAGGLAAEHAGRAGQEAPASLFTPRVWAPS